MIPLIILTSLTWLAFLLMFLPEQSPLVALWKSLVSTLAVAGVVALVYLGTIALFILTA